MERLESHRIPCCHLSAEESREEVVVKVTPRPDEAPVTIAVRLLTSRRLAFGSESFMASSFSAQLPLDA